MSTSNADRDFAGPQRPTRRAILQGALVSATIVGVAADGGRKLGQSQAELGPVPEDPRGISSATVAFSGRPRTRARSSRARSTRKGGARCTR